MFVLSCPFWCVCAKLLTFLVRSYTNILLIPILLVVEFVQFANKWCLDQNAIQFVFNGWLSYNWKYRTIVVSVHGWLWQVDVLDRWLQVPWCLMPKSITIVHVCVCVCVKERERERERECSNHLVEWRLFDWKQAATHTLFGMRDDKRDLPLRRTPLRLQIEASI